MILLVIEALCVIILVMILSMLVIDEKKRHARSLVVVQLKGYWDGDERRSTDRLNLTLEVKYEFDGRVKVSQSKDISEKGIRLLLGERIEKDSPIIITIRLPNQHRPIRAAGWVVWTNEASKEAELGNKRLFNTGIKFSKFHDTGEKRLFDFICEVEKTLPKK